MKETNELVYREIDPLTVDRRKYKRAIWIGTINPGWERVQESYLTYEMIEMVERVKVGKLGKNIRTLSPVLLIFYSPDVGNFYVECVDPKKAGYRPPDKRKLSYYKE